MSGIRPDRLHLCFERGPELLGSTSGSLHPYGESGSYQRTVQHDCDIHSGCVTFAQDCSLAHLWGDRGWNSIERKDASNLLRVGHFGEILWHVRTWHGELIPFDVCVHTTAMAEQESGASTGKD